MHVGATTLFYASLGAGALALSSPATLHGRAKGAVTLPDGSFHRERWIREANAITRKYSALRDLLQGIVPGLATLPLLSNLPVRRGVELERREPGLIGELLTGLLPQMGGDQPTMVSQPTSQYTPPAETTPVSTRMSTVTRAAPASSSVAPPTVASSTTTSVSSNNASPTSRTAAAPTGTSGSLALTDVIVQNEDIEYYGSLQIGTPAQTMNIDFDTGSADLWVPLKEANNTAAPYFVPGMSSTFKDSTKKFEVYYGLGDVSGTRASDDVTIAGVTSKGQSFGAISTESAEFQNDRVSGILGLGFQSIATGGTPWFDNIARRIASGALAENLFTFFLTRGQKTGSVLTIGSIPEPYAASDITYTPVTSESYWEVSMPTIRVAGTAVAVSVGAAIDTGTTLIYVPSSVAAAIWSQVPGAKNDTADSTASSTFYMFPCANKPEISLVFAGSDIGYTISPEDLNFGTATGSTTMCVGSLVGQSVQGSSDSQVAIVGDAFLKNVFTVFHRNGSSDGGPAVGFTTLKS